ncbi:MAG: serine/threonine protein kinase, partial [Archangium sp.]|nr:serine/threonine protein kinase [Archangium sp.]
MAEIWLARQTGLKGFAKLMVIKRMINALQDDPDSVEMFLTEARLAAQLTHPHVVQISELGDQGGSLYIVMEYLDGEDLAVVRRTGQKHGLPLLDHYAAKLVAMAAEGLHYAHTLVGLDGKPLRIVHRDVSPQNLIVTFDGSVKVVDFGIAKPASQMTNSGKLKGKLAYMSPEQARG